MPRPREDASLIHARPPLRRPRAAGGYTTYYGYTYYYYTPYCGYTYYYYYCGYTYYGYTTYCGHTYYGYTTYYGYAYCGSTTYYGYTYYGSSSPSTASTHRASASMRSMRLAWRRSD